MANKFNTVHLPRDSRCNIEHIEFSCVQEFNTMVDSNLLYIPMDKVYWYKLIRKSILNGTSRIFKYVKVVRSSTDCIVLCPRSASGCITSVPASTYITRHCQEYLKYSQGTIGVLGGGVYE